eukprot:4827787-Prymnesium_polylepis.1
MKRVPCKHMRGANAALQEVKVLMACNFDGIVGYHDFFLDTDAMDNIVICLLMEYCDGGDLWETIASARRERRQLDQTMCTGWLLQLIQALRYLHAQNILHRDIKPENIFITTAESGDTAVKLGDFGLAMSMEGEATKTQVGTPDYMAPEVLEGRPYAAAADIFSLGAVLYAMVCAAFPKMLALALSQGKPLDWGAASQPDAQQLAADMLQLAAEARPSLEEIAARAAALPTAQAMRRPAPTAPPPVAH